MNTYQRVEDAGDADDAVVVRIWEIDGELVGEADAPNLMDAQTKQVHVVLLGNPVPVRHALDDAQAMLAWMPYTKICVQIDDDQRWQNEWGTLLPIKP